MTNDLFTQLDINGAVAKNRFGVAPMTRVNATEDGRANEVMASYYERFARGGFGTVISEGIYTDQSHSQGYICQPGISDDAQARSWRQVVLAIQAHGALAVAQIMHAGAISQNNRFLAGTVAPSAIRPKGKQMTSYYGKGTYAVPAALSDEQIAEVITGFGAAAERARIIAGFDAIEIHGANGYLLDQFLTDYTNSREDRWGGDVQARLELTLAVLRQVRTTLGATTPIGVRISQSKVNDFHHKWKRGEADAEIVFGSLADAGADFIHVTEFEAWKPAFGKSGPTLAELAKKHAPQAVIFANGSLHEAGRANEVAAAGIDIVTLGRGALASLDLPNRLAEGRPLNSFDPLMLSPIANIKECELASIEPSLSLPFGGTTND